MTDQEELIAKLIAHGKQQQQQQQQQQNKGKQPDKQSAKPAQPAQQPATQRIPMAGWITFAQWVAFLLNAFLNWVVLWFYLAPKQANQVLLVEDGVASLTPPTALWNEWWWLVLAMIAIGLQVIFLYVPMFIQPDNRVYGNWRGYLQKADTGLNYVAFIIVAAYVTQAAPELRTFLNGFGVLLTETVLLLGSTLTVNLIFTLVVVLGLSYGVSMLSLITTLIPKTQQKK